jgi:hypothetical protein
LRALRASLESIKQVVQGVHDDLVVSQGNYTEMAGYSYPFQADERTPGEMDRISRPSRRREEDTEAVISKFRSNIPDCDTRPLNSRIGYNDA